MDSYAVGLLLILCAATPVLAQVDAEPFLDAQTDEAAATAALETLERLAAHPVPLNTAPVHTLAQIPGLGYRRAVALVRFRDTFGPFATLADLRAVEGIDEAAFAAVRPYLTLALPDPTPTGEAPQRAAQFRLRQRYSRQLTLGRGYTPDTTRTTYLGSPGRVYTRLQMDHPRLRLNLTAEKDPAEPFAWAPGTQTYGFDFTSAHVAVRDLGPLQTLIVGDYAAAFGQGLVFWRNSGFGKGRNPVRPIVRSGAGLVPYGSTNENAFLRGLAATLRLTPTLALTALASRRSLDATWDPAGFIRTLGTSGLHRTPAEMARKDQLLETLLGGALAFSTTRVQLGLTAYRSQFDLPVLQQGLPTDRMAAAGLYGTVLTGPLTWFGEVARAGRYAGLGGVEVQSGTALEAVLLVRHYPRGFAGLHGFGFGERNGQMQDETGWYLGLKLRLPGPWRVAGYIDQFHFSDVGGTLPRPGVGYDALAVLDYDPPGNRTAAYVHVRHETKSVSATVPDLRGVPFPGVEAKTRQSVRLHGTWKPEAFLRVRGRIEGTRSVTGTAPAETGFLLYQELRWYPHRRVWVEGRLTFFDTTDFDARVYAFENDVRYVLSNPALSGQGQRTYVLVQYAPTGSLTCWLKWAETQYEHVHTIGSGLDEAQGNRRREVRVQVQLTW